MVRRWRLGTTKLSLFPPRASFCGDEASLCSDEPWGETLREVSEGRHAT
jgi:hypothetical protein